MKQDTTIWQTSGATVFKLKESGRFKRVDGKQVPELVNEFYIHVESQNVGIKPNYAFYAIDNSLLAEHLAKLLNANPL